MCEKFHVVIIVIVLLIFNSCSSGFGPEYDSAEIKQKIGGVLLCNSVYTADIHNWQFDVDYKYKLTNGQILNIGSGTYCNREWNKDEQLIRYKNWIILTTGNWYGTDKIIVADIKTGISTNYHFEPDSIEKEKLWKRSNIHSLLNYCCAEALIDKIDNGQIRVQYKFRTNEKITHEYGKKSIYYSIDTLTGQPIMTKIE